jgi:hypothetical protein
VPNKSAYLYTELLKVFLKLHFTLQNHSMRPMARSVHIETVIYAFVSVDLSPRQMLFYAEVPVILSVMALMHLVLSKAP